MLNHCAILLDSPSLEVEMEREIPRYRLQGRAPYLFQKYSVLIRPYYFMAVKVKNVY